MLFKNKKSVENVFVYTFLHFFAVDFTDQISNSIIEELQVLANLKKYLSGD